MRATHVYVVLLAILNAALVAGGGAFQRLAASRGHPLWSGWMLLAILCLAPSFLVVSWAYAIGGKISLFVPVTAVGYVLSLVLAKYAFHEDVRWVQWLGCGIIVVGVALIARPK